MVLILSFSSSSQLRGPPNMLGGRESNQTEEEEEESDSDSGMPDLQDVSDSDCEPEDQ